MHRWWVRNPNVMEVVISLTRGTSGLYFQVSRCPNFQTPAKPASDWLEKNLRAVSYGRIHVTNIKILWTSKYTFLFIYRVFEGVFELAHAYVSEEHQKWRRMPFVRKIVYKQHSTTCTWFLLPYINYIHSNYTLYILIKLCFLVIFLII